ncbi:hypothetical protein RUND412_009692 [Rhizina undulata]
MASLSSFRLSRSHSTTDPNQRIILQDNTLSRSASTTNSPEPSEAGRPTVDGNSPSPRKPSPPGKREILRKAIAQRKYDRWSRGLVRPGEHSEERLPDPRAGGMVVERRQDGESVSDGSIMKDEIDGAGDEIRPWRRRTDTGGLAEREQRERRARGNKRKERKAQEEIAEIDVLYENQRGMFACGIPLFSSKSLLNFDPAPWQNKLMHDSAVSIVDAQVPDPSWVWAWKTWYVDMTQDVDEEGWTYSFSFNPHFAWHGTHIWFHSFVRRRRWLRKRIKLPSENSSREASRERGHGLNQDYFTIHSKHRDGVAGSFKQRRTVMEGGDWDDDESEEEAEEITDVPALMRVLKKARLDREKVEAVERFVEEGGEEVAYLADMMSALMQYMIFQASRRQLLSHLVAVSKKLEDKLSSPSSPSPSSPPPTTTSQQPPLPSQPNPQEKSHPSSSSPPQDTKDPKPSPEKTKDKASLQRKFQALQRAIAAADAEVKKLEFWSDLREVVKKGENSGGEAGDEWGLGLALDGMKVTDRDKGKAREV